MISLLYNFIVELACYFEQQELKAAKHNILGGALYACKQDTGVICKRIIALTYLFHNWLLLTYVVCGDGGDTFALSKTPREN